MNEKEGFIKVLTNLANTGLLDQSLDNEHYQLLGKNLMVIDLMQKIVTTPNLFGSSNLDAKFWSKFFEFNSHLKDDHQFTQQILPFILKKSERKDYQFNDALNYLKLENDDILKIMHFFPSMPYQNYDLIKPNTIDKYILKKYLMEKEVSAQDSFEFKTTIFSHSYLPEIKAEYFQNQNNIILFSHLYPHFDDELKNNKQSLLSYIELNKRINLNIVPKKFLEDLDVLRELAKYDIYWINDDTKSEFSFENHELFKIKLESDSLYKFHDKKYDHAWKNILNFYLVIENLLPSDKRADSEKNQELFFNILQKTKKHHKIIMQQWKNSKIADDGIWNKGMTPTYWNHHILPVIKEFCKVNYEMEVIEKSLDKSNHIKNISKGHKL